MRSINISEDVWRAIAARGKFGETEDDVLKRVFQLPINSSKDSEIKTSSQTLPDKPRQRLADKRLSSFIRSNQLHLSFENGPSRSWQLPSKSNKESIRIIRDEAVTFARENDATGGQVAAVRKTLTDSGYYLMR